MAMAVSLWVVWPTPALSAAGLFTRTLGSDPPPTGLEELTLLPFWVITLVSAERRWSPRAVASTNARAGPVMFLLAPELRIFFAASCLFKPAFGEAAEPPIRPKTRMAIVGIASRAIRCMATSLFPQRTDGTPSTAIVWRVKRLSIHL